MPESTAFVFPGMGPTPFAEVARFMLVDRYARPLVAQADERLGHSLVDRYADTPGDYSVPAQVSFLVNCLALSSRAEAERGSPSYVTGPSFGGKAAAVFSGALSLGDAVWLTAEIARCLEEYFAEHHRDAVTQSFARTPLDRLAEVTDELDADGVWWECSCRVDDDFAMLTLPEDRVEWLLARLRSQGGLPLYLMRPPMHCAAFGALADKVEDEVLSRVEFADPALPIVADQDGRVVRTGGGVRRMILDGFTRAVDWPAVVSSLTDLGVTEVAVCGQDALFSRVRRTRAAVGIDPFDPRRAMLPVRRGAAV